MDLYGRALVDIAIALINGYLLCDQAASTVDMQVPVAADNSTTENGTIAMTERKALLARRYIIKNAPKITALAKVIRTGDKSTFADYPSLIGPVPAI